MCTRQFGASVKIDRYTGSSIFRGILRNALGVMTCCVQDIQFVGFPCSYDGYKALEQRAWVRVTAKVGYKFHNIYRGKGPVLTAVSVEPAEKPLEEVVTFS